MRLRAARPALADPTGFKCPVSTVVSMPLIPSSLTEMR